MYYAHINSKNILTGIDMSKMSADEYGSEDVQNIEVDKTLYDNKQKYGIEYYTYKDGEIVKNQNYEEEQAQKERERLNLLSMTKREMFLGLYQAKGITPDMLKAQITNPQALIEFEYANDYYRGNPLIDVIGTQLGFTSEQLDKFFETKDYTYLIPSEQVEDTSEQFTDIVTDQVEETDDNTTDTAE